MQRRLLAKYLLQKVKEREAKYKSMPGLNLASGQTEGNDIYNQRLSYPSIAINYQISDQSCFQQRNSWEGISNVVPDCGEEDKHSPEIRSESSARYSYGNETRRNELM